MTLAILDGRLPDAAALLVLFVMVVVMMMAMVMGVLIMLVGLLTIVVIERVLHRDATRPEKPTHHHQISFATFLLASRLIFVIVYSSFCKYLY